MLSTWTLTRHACVLIAGDSNNDLFYGFRQLQPLIEATTYHYTGARRLVAEGAGRLPSAGLRCPSWVNKSFSGATVQQINETIEASLASAPFTHVCIPVGVNDRGTLRSETQNACEEIAEKLTSYNPNVLVLWIGPYATGERWPSGANNPAFDQRMEEVNEDIPIYFCGNYANSLYVDLRTTMYAVDMPTLNAPAPGAAFGIFTEDELHFNSNGRAWCWQNYIRPVVSFG